MYFCLHKDLQGNKLPIVGKVEHLKGLRATIIAQPNKNDIPADTIAVIRGYFYEMCLYVGNRYHFDTALSECRPITWLHFEGAEKLSGYKCFTKSKSPFTDVSQFGKDK